MRIYTLKIVNKRNKQSVKIKIGAACDSDAFAYARVDYPLDSYDIFSEGYITENDMEAKERAFHALLKRQCYDCG